MSPPLSGKAALVTGASRGIGRAIALKLAEDGADLALFARSEGPLGEVAAQVQAAGRRAVVIPGDVSKSEDAKAAVERAVKDLGRLDILVNNAGVTRDNLLLRMRDEEWTEVLDANLKGTFFFSRAAARHFLRERAGRIINVSSVVGLTGNPGQANYAASKGGIIAFTMTLAKELAGKGITANAIAPGFIETEMTARLPAEAREAAAGRIPLCRFGRPEEVASVASFLAGPGASYINGAVVRVDGGLAIA